jgi:hypothetical protein
MTTELVPLTEAEIEQARVIERRLQDAFEALATEYGERIARAGRRYFEVGLHRSA